MLRCISIVVSGFLCLLLWGAPVSGQTGGKAAVPDRATQDKLLTELKAAEKEAYAQASTNRIAAQQLLERLRQRINALKEENGPERFVLLNQSSELAAAVGDLEQALATVTDIEQIWDVDGRQLRVTILTRVSGVVDTPEQARALAERALTLADDCVRLDNYSLALKAVAVAETAAHKGKLPALAEEVQRQRRGIVEGQKAFGGLREFAERLTRNPDDGEANYQMGRYLCLLRGDWERGLGLLAQGNQMELRRLAQRDLNNPEEGKEQVLLGDGWWERGLKEKDLAQTHLRQRAAFWYEQALASADAQLRAKLEERIAATPRGRHTLPAWDYSGQPGQILVINGHNNPIFGAAFSPDGRRIASGCIGNQAFIWDATTGKRVQALGGHAGLIWNVAWDPAGKRVFTASWDGHVHMFDAGTGKELGRFPRTNRLPDINGIAVSKDGKYLLSGDDGQTMRQWEIQSGKEIRQFRGHTSFVYGVAFSPDGKQALSGGSGDTLMLLWDVEKGNLLHRFGGIGGQLRTVQFSPDGRLAVAAGNQAPYIYDLRTRKALRRFDGHAQQVRAAVFSPDGKRLATAADDGVILLFDVASGKQLHRFTGHNGPIYSLAFSPGGGRLVSGGNDNTLRVWGLPR